MGYYAHACAHGHARTLPNTEALGPEIEEGVVNRRPLQASLLLPRGSARPDTFPVAILIQPMDYVRGLVSSENKAVSRRLRTPGQQRLDDGTRSEPSHQMPLPLSLWR